MEIFRKNPNEVVYTGGKKHWADVIKNAAPGNLLIWRQPEEDFNTNSTLIVMPGESAIFIKGGVVEQVFENGTYKLSTENYPFISRLRNAFTGGISTFNCVVYFVRQADSEEIIWGTDSPIAVRDKAWGIMTEAKARGAYKVRIVNPSKLLEKLVGNNIQLQVQKDLNRYFQNELQSKIKSAVSMFLNSLNQELVGIDAYLDMLSEQIEPYVSNALADYGLKCVKFSLSGLDVDKTKYDAIDDSQIQRIAGQRKFQTEADGLQILGDDWARVQGIGILRDLANNPGAGGAAAAGAGVGMGIGAAGAFGAIAQQVFSPENTGFGQGMQTPGRFGTSGRFTQKSAAAPAAPEAPAAPVAPAAPEAPAAPVAPAAPAASQEDPVETLGKLKRMLDNGLIEQSEYDAKKKEILSRM